MKHLVALALKYLRRQRFRTLLTFLCITLSVFIFCLFCDTLVILRSVGLYAATENTGDWEINAEPWVSAAKDPDKAIEVLRNHALVDKYYYHAFKSLSCSLARNSSDCVYYLNVQVDDEEPHMVEELSQAIVCGDGDLKYGYQDTGRIIPQADEVILPESYQQQGYSVGDTVTITVYPVYAHIPPDQEAEKQLTAELLKNADEEMKKRPLFSDSPGAADAARTVYEYPFMRAMIWNKTGRKLLKDLVIEPQFTGDPVRMTAKIGGFSPVSRGWWQKYSFTITTSYDSDFDITNCLSGVFAAAQEVGEMKGNPHFELRSEPGMPVLSLIPNVNFDDAAEQLIKDMGVPAKERLELLFPTDPSQTFNTDLLMMQFRGANGITRWFFDDWAFVTITLVLLGLLFWALMRFVIDNAFEISVQERSAQFAALRVMGASKRQIAVLVCMEATCYSVLAIPLGVLASQACRFAVLRFIRSLSFDLKETSFPALTVLAVVLALLAVYISAYTSSMWAARMYSPLEGAQRTKLKGNRRESIWTKSLFGTKKREEKISEKAAKQAKKSGDLKAPRKSKLNRKRGSFLRHYTMRNIRRTRKRFLIAVITMTFGVLLFTFGISFGLIFLCELMEHTDELKETQDFSMYFYGADIAQSEQAIADFRSSGYYEWVDYEISMSSLDVTTESLLEAYEKLLPAEFAAIWKNQKNEGPSIYNDVNILTRELYEASYADALGFDYDAFLQMDGAILSYNQCGPYQNWSEAALEGVVEPKAIYPEGYQPVKGDAPLLIFDYSEETLPVIGAYCNAKERSNSIVVEIPIELLQKHLPMLTEYDPYRFEMNVRMRLRNSQFFLPAKEAADQFVRRMHEDGNTQIRFTYDGYFSGTGMTTLIAAVVTVCGIILLAVWGVGIVTMLNTINTGVLNRAEELAMLRMVGMTKKQVQKTVALEGQIYCGISALIGGLLGIAAMLYMSLYSLDQPLWRVAAIAVITLAFVVLVNIGIARIAARPGLRALNARLEAGKMMQ